MDFSKFLALRLGTSALCFFSPLKIEVTEYPHVFGLCFVRESQKVPPFLYKKVYLRHYSFLLFDNFIPTYNVF